MTRNAIDGMLTVATEEVMPHQEMIDGESFSEEPAVPIMFLEDEFCRSTRYRWVYGVRSAPPADV